VYTRRIIIFMAEANISVVVACMNRGYHLQITLPGFLALPFVNEVIVVDYNSKEPFSRSCTTTDDRLRIQRVEGAEFWSLSRAYNLGIALARYSTVFKVDADMFIDNRLFLLSLDLLSDGVFISGNPFGIGGPLLVSKGDFERSGCYNQNLLGWGFEEVDLYRRLRENGVRQKIFQGSLFRTIPHDDSQRNSSFGEKHGAGLTSSALKELTNLSNCFTSIIFPSRLSLTDVLAATSARFNGSDHFLLDLLDFSFPAKLSSAFIERIRQEIKGDTPPYIINIILDSINRERSLYESLVNIDNS